MEAWTKLNAPGDAHQVLAGMAGSWAMEVRTWMAPGAPPSSARERPRTR